MTDNFLSLPERAKRPRENGLTMLIDTGSPTNYFVDVVQSHGHLIDAIKFGWGTALITKDLPVKLQVCRENRIEVFFGGTFFEKAALQKRVPEYVRYCRNLGLRYMEISNGSTAITRSEKADFIYGLSREFLILSEVGSKDPVASEQMTPAQWLDDIEADLSAGAKWVILESRESGNGGTCSRDGKLIESVFQAVISAAFDRTRLVIEAPTKELQSRWIHAFGSDVNLANIRFDDVISLESMRLGLRADTFHLFESRDGFAHEP